MSTQTKTTVVEKVMAQKDDAEAKAPTLFSVGKKLSAFRRKLSAYTRFKDRVLQTLKDGGEPPSAPGASDEAAKAPEKKPLSKVHECYKLIRNFSLTYNWLNMKYEERQDSVIFIPSKFEGELEKLLSKDILAKFLECMKGKKEDIATNLPAEFDDAKVQKVTKFIDEKDKEHVIDPISKIIDDAAAEFEVLKAAKKEKVAAEPKSPKSSDDKKKRRSKKDKAEKDRNSEELFQDMISQIKKRVSDLRFKKDDYQVYAEVQGQIDLLLYDANYELHKVKKLLKKKFENAQKKAEAARPRTNSRARRFNNNRRQRSSEVRAGKD